MRDPRDPVGPQDWQDAVDSAQAMLLLHAALSYGLVEGIDPDDIDVDRCEELIRRAARHGMAYPRPDDELTSLATAFAARAGCEPTEGITPL